MFSRNVACENTAITLHCIVDVSRAGHGDLDVFIKSGNKKVPHKVVEKYPGVYKVYFLPREPMQHLVAVMYTKEHIPGEGSAQCEWTYMQISIFVFLFK